MAGEKKICPLIRAVRLLGCPLIGASTVTVKIMEDMIGRYDITDRQDDFSQCIDEVLNE